MPREEEPRVRPQRVASILPHSASTGASRMSASHYQDVGALHTCWDFYQGGQREWTPKRAQDQEDEMNSWTFG